MIFFIIYIVYIYIAGMVSISSKHLREVSDPVGELLTQLHKIVYLAKVRTDGHFIDRGSILAACYCNTLRLMLSQVTHEFLSKLLRLLRHVRLYLAAIMCSVRILHNVFVLFVLQ